MRPQLALSHPTAMRSKSVRLASLMFILSCQDTQDPQGPATALTIASVSLPGAPDGGDWTVAGNVGHTAALLRDGTVLVVGGDDDSGIPVSAAQIYNPVTGLVRPIAGMTTPRSHASATPLADGRVLVAAGTSGIGELASLEIFDPATATFSALPSGLATSRRDQRATALSDGRVLIQGGTHAGAAVTAPEFWDAASESVSPAGSLDGIAFATVATDRSDYVPGEHVGVTGTGFQPGETVNLLFDETPITHWPHWISVVAGPDGKIATSEYVLETHDLNTAFVLTASGQTSGWTAVTKFTDSGDLTYSPTTQGITVTTGGSPVSFTQAVTAPPGLLTFSITVQVIPSGTKPLPASWIKTSPTILDYASSVTHSWSVITTVPAGTPAGQYTGAVQGHPSIVSVTAGAGTALTVTVPNAIPVANAHGPYTVPEGGSVALSGTGTDANSDTLTFNWDLDGDGSFETPGPNPTFSAAGRDGPSSQVVTLQACDPLSACAITTATVNITNVTPVATFSGTPAVVVNEGSTFTLQLTNPIDPSPADLASLQYAFDCGSGYAAASTTPSRICATTDNGTGMVRGKVIDKDGAFTEYTAPLTVNNVAPTATLRAPTNVDEGSPIIVSLDSAFDPSPADTNAGFTYAFDCGTGSGYGPFGAAATTTCPTTDNGSRTVRGTIRDKDGAGSEYTATVTIDNVAPTAPLSNGGPINEGSSVTVSFGTVTDPSPVDVMNGFHYAFDCGSGYGAAGTSATGSCAFDDNGSFTVHGKVIDKDGGFTESQTTVVVNNVAPTAVIANGGPVNEGSPVTVTLSGASDPSTADTQHGFLYAFDCGGGYGDPIPSAVGSCRFDDNGSYTVHAKIIDKDGGFTPYDTTVVVNNVAPTATLVTSGATVEGGSATLQLINPVDPSMADTQHGFQFAFDCGAGYGAAGTIPQATCAFDNDGHVTVRAKITDKDGGSSEYSATVDVGEVAPTAVFTGGTIAEGGTAIVSFANAFDPSNADTAAGFRYAVACDGGSLAGATWATSSAAPTAPCSFADNGSFPVRGRIIEEEGAYTEYLALVVVTNVAPTATLTAPASVNEGSSFTLSLGNPFDPSSVDTAAGFQYAFDCGGGYGAIGTSASTTCSASDNGTLTAHAKIIDKDGGASEYPATVIVHSLPPTAQVVAPQTVTEGSTFALSLVNPTDPSPADLAAGFSYQFDCGTGYGDVSATPTATCFAADNPSVSVKARIIDKDLDATEYAVTITVANVPPSAQFTAPETVAHDSTFTLALAQASDPSPIDFAQGFTYAFDCGAGYGSPGSASTASCVAPASGTLTVRGKIIDKDGGTGEYTATVFVSNVAPTATFSNSGPIPEGGAVTVSFTNPSDPSPADTAAGFHYAFACDGGSLAAATYAGSGTASTKTCSFADEGDYTVRGRIIDREGAFSEYTTLVSVADVPPVIGVVTGPVGPMNVGDLVTLKVAFSDGGTVDTHTCSFAWGDGASSAGTVVDLGGSGTCTGSHSYESTGTFTATVSVSDDDAETVSSSIPITVVSPSQTRGFTGGGGWFDSPTGALPGSPSVRGPALFEFFARTGDVGAAPRGFIEIHLRWGRFNFRADTLQSLVLSGTTAVLHGTGTLNWHGHFSFTATAIDGHQAGCDGHDKLRIQIRDDDHGGAIVYDNQPGQPSTTAESVHGPIVVREF